MKPSMETARQQLLELIQQHQVTVGMCIRVRGQDLVLSREEDRELEDRIKFTRLGTNSYGVSVKRHTGRWERTPFSGPLQEVVDTVTSFMQHLVAPY
jgi:hypothetical protein